MIVTEEKVREILESEEMRALVRKALSVFDVEDTDVDEDMYVDTIDEVIPFAMQVLQSAVGESE